ncbi:MAG TPA: hypothetical protein PK280_14575 [Planctomycetota bacterium]|nr:hypothetical protein [Planctomycetota bacterium]
MNPETWSRSEKVCGRSWIAAISVLLSVLALAAPAHAGAVYQSDFDRQPDGPAKLEDWKLAEGKYAIEKGWLTVKSDKSNPSAMLKVKHDGDGTFRATVRNARSCHRTALVAGGYALEINKQRGLELQRLSGKDWKAVGTAVAAPWLYPRNTHEFELRLVRVGRKVSGFVDDKKLFEHEDAEPPPPAGGGYGFTGGWGTDVAWRGVQLSAEPDLSEWPYESLPKAAPRDLVEVAWVRCPSGDGLYFDGEKPGLKFRLRTARQEPTEVKLRLRLIDVRQQEAARESRSVTLAPGKEQELAVEFEPPRRGCFKVALDAGLGDADSAWVEDLGGFTVVSRRLFDAPRDEKSPFGGHMDGINLAWHLAVGKKLGIQWARCHNMMQWTWWTQVQPKGPDEWVWGDKAQKQVDDAKLATLGQFLYQPKWAAEAKPGKSEAFARYVGKTVEHYRGSIRHWEVWNEPHYSGFWTGTPEEYAELLAVTCREAKKSDPECLVLGGGGLDPRSPVWLKRFLAAADGKTMDGFSIHYLEPDFAAEFMPELRRELAAKGVSGPIWNSEECVWSTSFFDQLRKDRLEPEARYHFRNACYELVRTYMENLAGGVERIFYYEQADPWRFREFPKPRVPERSEVTATMWDEGRMLRPIGAAHAAMALAIEGRTYRTRVTAGALQAFVFEGEGSAVAVQYATFRSFARREAVRLKLPDGQGAGDFTVIDFMGNETAPVVENGRLVLPLSREPVYLVCKGAGGRQALQAMYEGAEGPKP